MSSTLAARPEHHAAAALSPEARAVVADTLAAETVRAYRRQIAQIERRLGGAPLDDASLAAVLARWAADGAGRATLAQAVAAVRWTARHSGAADPVGPSSRVVLAAHRRRNAGPQRQAAPLPWGHADAAAETCAREGDPLGLRDAAIVAVGSDAMLRVGELAALDIDDIARRDDGSATLTIRRSKTDQHGDGAELWLSAATVARIDAWTAAAGIDSGPLWRRVRRGGHVGADRLGAQSIRAVIASAAAAVGIDGASGHSLRVGGAVSLARAGASVVEMQQAGRWASTTMPARYARGELAARGAVARLRYGR